MKIIGINARSFGLGHAYGVKEYVTNIFSHILSIDKENSYIFFSNENFEIPFKGNYKKVIIPGNKVLFDWLLLPQYLQKENVDIFLSPQTTLGFVSKKIKQISVVHDIGYIYNYYSFFDSLYWKINFFFSFRRADKVITVSNFTKNEIENNYKIKGLDVSAIYHGRNNQLQEKETDIYSLGVHKKYILCIGSSYQRKNIGRLIESYKDIQEKIENIQLVVVTNSISQTKETFSYKEENDSNILFLENISKENYLNSLYKNSIFTVIPSIYEGFGFPIIEAQMFDSLVLCSNNSSLTEVIADSGITFNPFNIEDISDKLQEAYNLTDDQKNIYIQKGTTNIERFSWENAAQEYLRLLNSI